MFRLGFLVDLCDLRWFCRLRLFGLGGASCFVLRVVVGLPSCFRFLWGWYNIVLPCMVNLVGFGCFGLVGGGVGCLVLDWFGRLAVFW